MSHGALAYAAALDLFLRLDAVLSRALHADSAQKPFTVSPLFNLSQREEEPLLTPDAVYPWRITGLTSTLSEHLLKLSSAVGGVRFGKAIFTITTVATTPKEHPWAGQEDYASLMARWDKGPSGELPPLHFLTPTTFRAGRHEQPFPLPRWVFGSLLAAWNAFSPHPLHIAKDLIEDKVALSNWRGETRRLELGGSRTVGFIGKFTYRVLDPSLELRRVIGLLTEFAFYAGVGWQTTHGLGQVRLEQSKRRPIAPIRSATAQ